MVKRFPEGQKGHIFKESDRLSLYLPAAIASTTTCIVTVAFSAASAVVVVLLIVGTNGCPFLETSSSSCRVLSNRILHHVFLPGSFLLMFMLPPRHVSLLTHHHRHGRCGCSCYYSQSIGFLQPVCTSVYLAMVLLVWSPSEGQRLDDGDETNTNKLQSHPMHAS